MNSVRSRDSTNGEQKPLTPPRMVLLTLIGFSVLVMIGSAIGHGHWFKCNDVIRYGVWQWCASFVYFKYVAFSGNGMMVDDYVLMKGVRFDEDEDERSGNFMDNTHTCRGYGDTLYDGSGDVPNPIIIGRTFIMATHVATLICFGCYSVAYGDKLSGATRGLAVVMATILQCACYSVFCISMEAYLDSEETVINRTVVCWNGIIAWIGWCFSVIQVGISFGYFKIDDGLVEEQPIYADYDDNLAHHPHGRGGGYKSAASLMFDSGNHPESNPNSYYDHPTNGGRNSRMEQEYESRGYNESDGYA
ncbi:uncharacterized protein LOC142345986 [Convolutriloba macropyga]|uniref:uncharacterized protein LOC142345986 n=1 Tax=Convolutriloba macropyga TaxID=536237 RepID=UPI003F51E660